MRKTHLPETEHNGFTALQVSKVALLTTFRRNGQRVQTPVGMMTIATTHLSYVPGWNRRQLAQLYRNLTPFPDPAVLMGDLNLTCPLRRRPSGLS